MVTLTAASRKLLCHIAQRRLAEPAHSFRRQPPLPVGTAVQEALIDQRAFQFGKRAGVDGRLVTELAGKRVEVDVVHGRPRIALRELLGQLLELGDVGQRLGALTHPERVVTRELFGPAPVLARPRRLQVRIKPVQRLHQRG